LLSITYAYCWSWLPLCQIGMSRLLCAAKTNRLKARAKIPALSNCSDEIDGLDKTYPPELFILTAKVRTNRREGDEDEARRR